MTATVFNIQKFSLHDGPGIRTAVFFKGCPLKCKWCANPESQRQAIEVFTDTSVCTLVGREYTLEEILSEVKKDLVFYEQGGGVTLTGGEIFMQYDFVLELCKRLKSENIHIAVETSGFVSSSKFKNLAAYCDLIYIDLKHYEDGKHREGTGVPLLPIVKNIGWMVEADKNFIVRIPVIPDYNDSLPDAEGYARLLAETKVKQVQLLPFHTLGAKKYELLGKEYLYKEYSSLSRDDLEEYKNVLERYGVMVTNGAR